MLLLQQTPELTERLSTGGIFCVDADHTLQGGWRRQGHLARSCINGHRLIVLVFFSLPLHSLDLMGKKKIGSQSPDRLSLGT